jgi:CheY-like chemotaxis protein
VKTILLTEDEQVFRFDVCTALRNCGYSVVQAANGREAIRLAGIVPNIHLLLADIQLPDVNGIELAEILREKIEGLRVLFMTAPNKPEMRLLRDTFSIDDLIFSVEALMEDGAYAVAAT